MGKKRKHLLLAQPITLETGEQGMDMGDGTVKLEGQLFTKCPRCGTGVLVLRRRKADDGLFLGCSSFPACRFYSEYAPQMKGVVEPDARHVDNPHFKTRYGRKVEHEKGGVNESRQYD